MEADRQGHMEPVCLSDDTRDEYQMSHPGDETEPETESEGGNLSSATQTTPRRRCGPRLVTSHENRPPRTMGIATNSGSQDAESVLRRPTACVTITATRALSSATFPS